MLFFRSRSRFPDIDRIRRLFQIMVVVSSFRRQDGKSLSIDQAVPACTIDPIPP